MQEDEIRGRRMSGGFQKVEKQRTMFDAGQKFQPMPQAAVARGAMPLSGGVFARQSILPPPRPAPASLGQAATTPTSQPDVDDVAAWGQARRQGPVAWGRLKKLEAKELADQLAALTDRMRRAGIPYGIVEKIKDELASFAASNDPAAEIEISEVEAQQLNDAILALEEAEKNTSEAGVSTALTVAAVGLGAVLILSLG